MQPFFNFMSHNIVIISFKSIKSMTTTIFNKFVKRLAVFSFFLIGYTLQAQEHVEVKGQTYVITDNGSVKDTQPYIDALNNSDMKNHRLLNKRYTIIFKTGVKVELFSAAEISKSGLSINLSDYPESFDSSRQEPVFDLGTNNFIIEYHIAGSKHH